MAERNKTLPNGREGNTHKRTPSTQKVVKGMVNAVIQKAPEGSDSEIKRVADSAMGDFQKMNEEFWASVPNALLTDRTFMLLQVSVGKPFDGYVLMQNMAITIVVTAKKKL